MMTATILLIRHAAHAHVGHTLTGRIEGVPLAAEGEAQALALGSVLASEPLTAVQASPSLRTRQTADAIAASHGLQVEIAEPLTEVDFGEWEGRSFTQLEDDPRWHEWNTSRATAAAPGGESMAAVQQRAWDHIRAVAQHFAGDMVAIITHCDVIRAVIARVLSLSLDHILRFDIPPASVSRIVVGAWGAQVLSLNERPA